MVGKIEKNDGKLVPVAGNWLKLRKLLVQMAGNRGKCRKCLAQMVQKCFLKMAEKKRSHGGNFTSELSPANAKCSNSMWLDRKMEKCGGAQQKQQKMIWNYEVQGLLSQPQGLNRHRSYPQRMRFNTNEDDDSSSKSGDWVWFTQQIMTNLWLSSLKEIQWIWIQWKFVASMVSDQFLPSKNLSFPVKEVA